MPIDYSKYPPNWKTEIRPRILKRAKNECEFCDVENGSFIKQVVFVENNGWEIEHLEGRVVLTIMHMDHDPENWEIKDQRLRAACQRCHLAYDRIERMYNKEPADQLLMV